MGNICHFLSKNDCLFMTSQAGSFTLLLPMIWIKFHYSQKFLAPQPRLLFEAKSAFVNSKILTKLQEVQPAIKCRHTSF